MTQYGNPPRRPWSASLGGGVSFWLDGSTLTGANNDPISTWADLSANGFNATQAGANRPLLAAAAINGLNAVRFTAASSHYMSADAASALFTGNDTPYSIFFVLQPTDVAGNYTYFSVGNTGTNTQFLAHQLRDVTSYRFQRIDDAAAASDLQSGTPSAALHVLGLTFSGTTLLFTLDNTVIFNAAANVGACTWNRLTIGALGRAGVIGHYNGLLAEVLCYNRAVDLGQHLENVRALGSKWGKVL